MTLFKIVGTLIGLVLVFIPSPATTPAGLAILVATYAVKR